MQDFDGGSFRRRLSESWRMQILSTVLVMGLTLLKIDVSSLLGTLAEFIGPAARILVFLRVRWRSVIPTWSPTQGSVTVRG